jgi:hypothetical protein
MPCTSLSLTEIQKREQARAIERLRAFLAKGTVSVVVGRNGAVAFKGWSAADRSGVMDLCAFRKLQALNSPELRRALARAETLAGRTVDRQAIGAGIHSHDGGATWGVG